MSQEAVDAAAAKAEEHWSLHYKLLEEPIAAVRATLAKNQAATGVGMGPQLDAASTLAVHAIVDNVHDLIEAALHKTAALGAERDRDQITETLPPPPPDKPAPLLATGEPTAIRQWLQTATADDVQDALSAISGDTERVAWANQMMSWVREDGNVAAVIEVLRAAQPTEPEPRVDPPADE